MLLPHQDFWAWARASSQYVQTYGLNLTSDPVAAANYMAPGQVVSFPVFIDAYPEQGDLVRWFDANYPGIRVDPVPAETPENLAAQLQIRLDAQDRYGQRQRPFYLLWPTKYPVITQKFGANPQIYRRFGMPGHEGLDIRALPYTNITSAADGVVYEIHANPKDHPYGIHIRIRHQFGYKTIYGHLAKPMVRWGQQVSAGDVLAINKVDAATPEDISSVRRVITKLNAKASVLEVSALTPGDIVRIKRFAVSPMHREEALEQMELLGHDFFVFFDAETESFSVLYRRKDGNYGLLQPELA